MVGIFLIVLSNLSVFFTWAIIHTELLSLITNLIGLLLLYRPFLVLVFSPQSISCHEQSGLLQPGCSGRMLE